MEAREGEGEKASERASETEIAPTRDREHESRTTESGRVGERESESAR